MTAEKKINYAVPINNINETYSNMSDSSLLPKFLALRGRFDDYGPPDLFFSGEEGLVDGDIKIAWLSPEALAAKIFVDVVALHKQKEQDWGYPLQPVSPRIETPLRAVFSHVRETNGDAFDQPANTPANLHLDFTPYQFIETWLNRQTGPSLSEEQVNELLGLDGSEDSDPDWDEEETGLLGEASPSLDEFHPRCDTNIETGAITGISRNSVLSFIAVTMFNDMAEIQGEHLTSIVRMDKDAVVRSLAELIRQTDGLVRRFGRPDMRDRAGKQALFTGSLKQLKREET